MIEADNQAGAWGVWSAFDAGPAAAPATGARIGRPRVHTRFPPEPNGWLHLGHAKSICLNWSLARAYGGKFNLRFDDTNPTKEEVEYVEAIKRDVKWLGADYENEHTSFGGGLYYASDYFDQMYEFAKELILKGKAYVCQLSAEEMAARRGTPTTPGTSPYRDRPSEESMRLFREMKAGKHPDGSMTLRAKIDLGSPNFNLRDPVMYRIIHAEHHNTGSKWCVYPMYDWAHGLEDSMEGITHSICTLEFENHRPLYDWFIDAINQGRTEDGSGPYGTKVWHSRQVEFAKLIPTYTILSKRNLLKMVEQKVVSGWDDPRMPTIAGIRRRGYTPAAMQAFCEDVGVTKFNSLIDIARLENALRDGLNKAAPRYMAVLRPLKVVIENYPQGQVEELPCVNNPEDPGAGSRDVPFSREIYIERDDFLETPPAGAKFFRLAIGQEVRLRWAYFITATRVDKDAAGNVTTVYATYDPATRGGDAPPSPPGPDGKPGRKVKGTLHWVSAAHAVKAEVRLFDRLFKAEEPGARTGNFMDDFNPDSLRVVEALLEPALAAIGYKDDCGEGFTPGTPRNPRVQFERLGYFCPDRDWTPERPVWNRAVTLKDTWGKDAAGGGDKPAGGGGGAAERTYSFGQAAHTLKIAKEKLTELLTQAGLWAEVAKREPMTVKQSEFDAVKKLMGKKGAGVGPLSRPAGEDRSSEARPGEGAGRSPRAVIAAGHAPR
jgi:glutaminyl-tRNA synthetase